ncbi:oxidase [Blomia tropicalis]|nr:oxidase [Blomia tropicalis]
MFYLKIYFVITLIIIVFNENRLVQGNGSDLYENDPYIQSLTDSNALKNILNQNRVTIAIFYAHWCGHCINFSGIAKHFANQTRTWQSVMKIDIPEIRFYPPMSTEINGGTSMNLESDNNYNSLYNQVLEFLSINVDSVMATYATSRNDICLSESQSSTKNYVIVEQKPSLSGAELMLNSLVYKKYFQLKRFYGDSRLVDSFNSIHIQIPAILELEQRSTECHFRVLFRSGQDIVVLKDHFMQFIYDHYPLIDNIPVPVDPHSNMITNVTRFKLTYTDLYNTLRYTLLIEIPRTERFNQTQITRMNNWLSNKKERLSAKQYREAMRISDGFLKPMESWRHCNGSKPIYRGYPCGVWVLFHTMTVNEYVLGQKANQWNHEVLHTMRNYVATFFSCRDCAEHFVQATIDMDDHLRYPNSSVLYLWRIHNNVNERLRGDLNEDPFYPKRKYPSPQQCERCYDEQRYNQVEVFKYLLESYGKKYISKNGSLSLFQLSFTILFMQVISAILFNL